MNKKERKRLLNELNTIEELLELRKCEQSGSLPFILVFKLHMQDLPVYKIARQAKITSERASHIISGALTIPKNKIKAIKQLGYKICGCCGHRVVPIEPYDNVHLTTLCPICWKRGGDEDSVVSRYGKITIKLGEDNEKDIIRTHKVC